MVRSHARRSGISSVDDLESESVSTEDASTKNTPVIDVTWFGADPTGSIDSRQEIQDAINYAELIGGGVVYLPSGDYRIEGASSGDPAIKVGSDNITLAGAGEDGTRILSYWEGEDRYSGLLQARGTDSSTRISNVTFRDFTVELRSNWPRANIFTEFVSHFTIENVSVDQTTHDGNSSVGIPIWLGHDESAVVNDHITASNLKVRATAANNPCVELAGTDYGYITGCVLESVDGEGEDTIKVQSCSHVSVENNVCDSNLDGVNFLSVKDFACVGNTFDVGDDGIVVGSDDTAYVKQRMAISGNSIDAGQDGIRMDSGVGQYSISGNVIRVANIGIFLAGGDDDGLISGNLVQGGVQGLSNDRSFQKLQTHTIVGNHFVGFSGVAVELVSPFGVNFSGNTVDTSGTSEYHLVVRDAGNGIGRVNVVGNVSEGRGQGIKMEAGAGELILLGNSGGVDFAGDAGLSGIEVAHNV